MIFVFLMLGGNIYRICQRLCICSDISKPPVLQIAKSTFAGEIQLTDYPNFSSFFSAKLNA